MLGKKRTKKSTRIDTVIGKTTTIRGDIEFAGTLHVEGTVIGNIKAESDNQATLILDEESMVQGDVSVANILVNGTVEGDIFSTEHAELLAHARIKGNVYYNLIEMSVGSAVNGSLVHRGEEKAKIEYIEPVKKAEND
jgi:cytoskeletal protein CcmA (bactofilin family)